MDRAGLQGNFWKSEEGVVLAPLNCHECPAVGGNGIPISRQLITINMSSVSGCHSALWRRAPGLQQEVKFDTVKINAMAWLLLNSGLERVAYDERTWDSVVFGEVVRGGGQDGSEHKTGVRISPS